MIQSVITGATVCKLADDAYRARVQAAPAASPNTPLVDCESSPSGVFAPAIFSEDRTMRYTLCRRVDMFSERVCLFSALNPSKADELKNDPTVRREIDFAIAWGCGWLLKVNAFAIRATYPQDMLHSETPGDDTVNDAWILACVAKADIIVAAWGNHGTHRGRDVTMRQLLKSSGKPVYHMGLTLTGQPRHPLYLRADTQPILWAI